MPGTERPAQAGAANRNAEQGKHGDLSGDLLVQLYDTTLCADAWPRVLRLLAPLFGCTHASFIRVDHTHPRDSVTTLVGFPPLVAEALRNRNMDEDHFWRALLPMPAGSVIRASDALSAAAYRRGPIYRDIAAPNGLDYCFALVLENRPEEFTALSFLRGGEDFDAGHRALLTGLAPHLRAILQLTRRVALGDAGRREALRSFDRVGQPLVVLDRSGYAIHCNDNAGRILGQCDGVELKLGRFLFDNLAAQAEFERAVRLAVAATGGADVEPVPREVRVPRRRGGSPFALSVISCARAADRAVLPPGAGCLVLIYDADIPRSLPAARLAFLYRITPSELRVCESLFRTGSVEGVAEDISVSRNTVRSHLKRIYAKFGVMTQAQLMQKLANSVSMVEGSDDAEQAV